MAFSTLILARTLQTFAARSNSQTAFQAGFFSNRYVAGAVILCLCLYGFTVLPGVRRFFSIPEQFGLEHGLTAAGLALAAVILMELIKFAGNAARRTKAMTS
ncbi:Calcium-transporting ATPase [compost metagenome]